VFGNVDSVICHAVDCGYKRQVDSVLMLPSIWWVPALGLNWVLVKHFECLRLGLHFNLHSSVSHEKRNLDKCVYSDHLKATDKPETA